MYGVDMHTTIKTLLEKGKSQRSIAKQLNVSRKVVRRIKTEVEEKKPPCRYQRDKLLNEYLEQIKSYLDNGLNAELIHRKLEHNQGLEVSYSTVQRYVASIKNTEAYVPIQTIIGEEAQVDFGYLGKFKNAEGQEIKLWVFNMVLSYSRYAYYEVVKEQSVAVFIQCHIHAFEFFGGVPEWIRLDNLKAGVVHPDFYEPILQEQYSEFLAHYNCVGKPCRVRKPEHKGKVESGIKYLKNNLMRGLEHRDYEQLIKDVAHWNIEVCNKRIHGTTRKIPQEVFLQLEKTKLGVLPRQRYEIWLWEERKVNRLGHITFQNNYYSIPFQYVGHQLRVKSNGSLLKVFNGLQEVALHQLGKEKGQYITRQEHQPDHKQTQSLEYFENKIAQIGPSAIELMQILVQLNPRHWKEKILGLLSLKKNYSSQTIDQACKRALEYKAFSYLSVRNICQRDLTPISPQDKLPERLGGFNHDLSIYDQLS